MAFSAIDPTTPAGTDKIKFGDDRIREFKAQVIANLQELSNYPATAAPALRTAVWTTATRPSGDELVERVTGYNTDLGCEEYYDLANTKWITKGLTAWSVADRPASPAVGQYGYNIDLAVTERWSGSAWQRVSGDPRGKIDMWSGAVADIPTGWVLADGAQRTHPEGGNFTPPNLRDRFIVGAGSSYAVGATGGANTVTLDISTMPSHHHRLPGGSTAGSPWNMAYSNANCIMGGSSYNGLYDSLQGIQVMENTGGGQAHENRPPYYALCFLYKL